MCLSNLGSSQRARFVRLGELTDLEDALFSMRTAVQLRMTTTRQAWLYFPTGDQPARSLRAPWRIDRPRGLNLKLTKGDSACW